MDKSFSSIFSSVKSQLPLDPSVEDFDTAILASINSSIFTLRQLGIGRKEGFRVTSDKDTYEDYLGKANEIIGGEVDQYFLLNAKIFIDPPANSSVLETYKQKIKECEWRLCVEGPALSYEPIYSNFVTYRFNGQECQEGDSWDGR